LENGHYVDCMFVRDYLQLQFCLNLLFSVWSSLLNNLSGSLTLKYYLRDYNRNHSDISYLPMSGYDVWL